jgi:KAP family P-loop domain
VLILFQVTAVFGEGYVTAGRQDYAIIWDLICIPDNRSCLHDSEYRFEDWPEMSDSPTQASAVRRLLLIDSPSAAPWHDRVTVGLTSRLPEVQLTYLYAAPLLPTESAESLEAQLDTVDAVLILATPELVTLELLAVLQERLAKRYEVSPGIPIVTWVLAEYTPWQQTPLREYQAAISPDVPLASFNAEEFERAMDGLARDLSDLLARTPPRETPSSSPPAGGQASPPNVRPSPPQAGSPPLGSSPPSPPTPSSPYSSPPSSPSAFSPADIRTSPAFAASPVAGGTALTNRAAGFRPDTVKGDDRLSIRKEALTLAMVLAHKDVEPPISVGLFGDWGSGKSFFMHEMRMLIDGLSRRSKEVTGRFCENVVQLEFNAWHYMDSDLWASLAREIFEGLATALAEREKKPDLDLERERLRAATQSTKDLIVATEVQVSEVQHKLAETQQQLSNVQQQRASVDDVAEAAAIAVLQTPEVEKRLRELASQLGIDEAKQSIGELKTQVIDLNSTARRVQALLAGFKQRWRGLIVGLAAAGVIAFAVHQVMITSGEQIAAMVSRIVAAIGVIVAALSTVLPAAKAILKRAEDFKKSVDQQLEGQKERREKEVRDRRDALDAEKKQLEDQKVRQQEELERLKTLSRKLNELDSSRQLVDFIRARDASGDYRSRLGTVARASQDFKRLSDLMARAGAARKRIAAKKAIEADEEDARLPNIDRIVLYIDDLDRCPTNKVVDVLQAVHLLLAYPLFVVVVGVDPRWLLHSLEEHSGAFRTSDEPGEEASDEWRSTSLNYLEKIFQIPYTLRPMSSDGFTLLVGDLSASKSTTHSGPSSPSLASSSAGSPTAPRTAASPSVATSPSAARSPSSPPERRLASPATVSPASPSGGSPGSTSPTDSLNDLMLDPNPGALELDDRERNFMPHLYELIPTPRAAKRFVNVYRLIRASIDNENELRWFLDGGEFVAVQVLLAMVTGAPAEASEILRKLLSLPKEAPWTMKWWEVVDGMVKEGKDQTAWQSFETRLRSLRACGEVPETCEAFRKWADDVARYSFYSGRVLLGPQPAFVAEPKQ